MNIRNSFQLILCAEYLRTRKGSVAALPTSCPPIDARGKGISGTAKCGTCCGTEGNALKRSSPYNPGDTVEVVLVDEVEDCDSHETGRSWVASVGVSGEGIVGSTGRCLELWRTCSPRLGTV